MGKTKKKGDTMCQKNIAINYILNDFLMGAVNSVILQKLAFDEYGIGRKYPQKRGEELIREAREIMRADFQAERDDIREKLYNQLYDVYTSCREQNNHASALQALKQISALTGADEPEKKDVMIKSIDINFGFEEMAPIGFNTNEEDDEEDEERED